MKKTFRFVSLSEAVLFTRHQRNRMIDRKHLHDIKKQMLESFDTMPAITVNNLTMHVIDGQHRLEAYKQLMNEGALAPDTKIAVMFVEIPIEGELEAIIAAQVHSKSWNQNDYIHSYLKDGNQNYISLDTWCKTHTLTSNVKDSSNPKYRYGAIMMVGPSAKTSLTNGTFVVNDEQLRSGDMMHNECVRLLDVLGLPICGQWMEKFLTSWYKYRTLHKFTSVLSYIKTHLGSIRKMPKANVSDWDAIFARVSTELDLKNNKVA